MGWCKSPFAGWRRLAIHCAIVPFPVPSQPSSDGAAAVRFLRCFTLKTRIHRRCSGVPKLVETAIGFRTFSSTLLFACQDPPTLTLCLPLQATLYPVNQRPPIGVALAPGPGFYARNHPKPTVRLGWTGIPQAQLLHLTSEMQAFNFRRCPIDLRVFRVSSFT
ncbi:unnamed protein product [Periconia digitata]|uniref:Uncharacterized protein n=1 Tax=Periconia digitata TaxID=1303443 RepID=A0A9W4USC2_9PLEO|nr:unnamed protein product [Periconia digitata]